MTNKASEDLASRYLAGLRSHLGGKRGKAASVARVLGAEAAIAGGDTLALARTHESAMVTLANDFDFAGAKGGMLKRAGVFFAEALVPIERCHRANRESLHHLKAKADTLILHTAALSAGNRRLKKEVVRRRAAEESIRRAKKRYYRLFVQSQLMQKKLRYLARQMLSAQEVERREISRELHDEVVQTLVGINVQLSALGSSSLGLKAIKSNIAHTQRLVEKSVGAVHQFARELRPTALDDLGLIPALHALMRKVPHRRKFKICLSAYAGVEKLSPEKRIVLYRVAQESLTNVGRHANAALVNVSISAIPGAVRMEVHDDGKSFLVDKTLSCRTNKRLGLLGMRERVEMVGGALNIDSALGCGTTVRADIPFANTSL